MVLVLLNFELYMWILWIFENNIDIWIDNIDLILEFI